MIGSSEVWTRLAGIYGADKLTRAFGDTAPPDWRKQISELNDAQLNHGLDRLAISGNRFVPTLPDFVTACRSAREFTASANRALEDKRLDAWDRAANMHMMAMVMRRVMAKKNAYTEEQTRILCRAKAAWAQDMREDFINGEVDSESQIAMWSNRMSHAHWEWRDVFVYQAKAAA